MTLASTHSTEATASDARASNEGSAGTSLIPSVEAVRLVAVETGKNVAASAATAAANSVALTQVLQSTLLTGTRFVTSATLVGAAQAEECAILALRIPFTSQLATKYEMEGLVQILEHFAGGTAAQELAALPLSQRVLLVGVEGSLIAVLVAAAVQQSIATVQWVRGAITTDELQAASVGVAVQAAGTLSGSAAGAAVGTLLFPGAGTALGALLGSSSVGIAATWWYHSAQEAKRAHAEVCWNQSRMLEVKELPDEWIGVSDAPTSVRFRAQYDTCDLEAAPTSTTMPQQDTSEADEDGDALPTTTSCRNFSQQRLRREAQEAKEDLTKQQQKQQTTQKSLDPLAGDEVDSEDCITLYFSVPKRGEK